MSKAASLGIRLGRAVRINGVAPATARQPCQAGGPSSRFVGKVYLSFMDVVHLSNSATVKGFMEVGTRGVALAIAAAVDMRRCTLVLLCLSECSM